MNNTLAVQAAVPAMPPKPNIAATIAMIRNIKDQLSIERSPPISFAHEEQIISMGQFERMSCHWSLALPGGSLSWTHPLNREHTPEATPAAMWSVARRQQLRPSKTRQVNDVRGAPLEAPSVQNARRIYFTLATCRIPLRSSIRAKLAAEA